MSNSSGTIGNLLRALLWFTRILSLLLTAFILFFLLAYAVNPRGEGGLPGLKGWIELLVFPIGVCAGYLVGWRKQLFGGLLGLACVLAFILWIPPASKRFGMVEVYFALPGVLYVVYAIFSRWAAAGSEPA